MQKIYNKKNQKAFTLIELLIIVAIIGILAVIVITQFSTYRQKGFDARAKSDLYNVAEAEEAYYADNLSYIDCVDFGCYVLPSFTGLSDGVTLQMSAGDGSFTGTSKNDRGTGTVFSWDSLNGGLQ
jgi:prepilin-type N-terminal cleavage/methylation domain-containing protein